MSKFLTPLHARVTESEVDGEFRRTVTLNVDLIYVDDLAGRIVVKAGFESDGASVPQWFWNRYPPFGKYLAAAVVHDLLCVQGHADECAISSKEAAAVFYRAMLVCGVGKFRAWKMWQAVRWFGPRWKAQKKPTD